MIGLGSPVFGNSIFNNNFDFNLIDSEFLPSYIKNIPFVFTVLGIGLSTMLINCFGVSKHSVYTIKMTTLYRSFYTFLTQKWHFDQLVNEIIVVKSMVFGYRSTFQLIDKGNIEVFGPAGLSFNLQKISKNLTEFQSGFVSNYALFFTIMLVSILALLCSPFFYGLGFLIERDLILLFSYILFCLLI